MNVTSRFSEYMKANNILQKDVAELFGITPQAVSGILNGKSDFTTAQIVILAKKFVDLNARWLLTGDGKMITLQAGYKENNSLMKVEEYGEKCKSCIEKDKRIFDLEMHRDDLRKQLGLGKLLANGS